MPTPDDVRGAFNAMLNQIPDTMVASQGVLLTASALRSVKGEDGEIAVEKLHQLVTKLAATVTICVIELDNKVEKMAGRPGISDDLIEAIMSEFR